MLAHNVYFTLKDHSPQAIDAMVAACKKYLSVQPGIVFFAAGSLAGQYQREVNDRDFHVALHVIFAETAHHDAYQDDPQHKLFIEENRPNWAKVRVFDSNAEHAS